MKQEPSEPEKLLIDANVFLEVELKQERVEACKRILREFQRGEREGVISDFTVDTIVIIMEKYRKTSQEIRTFLSSLLGYRGLRIYFCTLLDRIEATRHMKEYDLNFDDALSFQAMRANGIKDIVSYDQDFDSIPGVRRATPEKLLYK